MLQMSSNSRITCSKGPSDGMSLPPYTRPRKDMNTKADNAESLPSLTQQQTACDQLNSTVSHSPFARPGSRQVQVQCPPPRQGCLRHPPVHLPSQVAAQDPHDRKWLSLAQPHKLQDHRAVIHQYHLLMTLCFHEMRTHRLAGT